MDENLNSNRSCKNTTIPTEIGRAEDSVKEAFSKSVKNVSENSTEVRHRVTQISLESGDKIRRGIQSVKDQLWDGKLLKHSELPKWMQDNEFILDFHRPEFRSFYTCAKSIFSIHSETGNIWTHMIGAILFFSFSIYYLCLPAVYFVSPIEEKTVTVSFLGCAFICLLFSTIYHTLGCHSPEVCLFCGRLDYTGIAVLITGSFLPWIYYSFYCNSTTKIIYMSSITILGIICSTVSMSETFASPKYRAYRGLLFVIFGLCGVVPCVHYVIDNGVGVAFTVGQMHWLILMGAIYISGAILFMTRFPECVWPEKFNLCFQSHQLFHVFVVAAALLQFYAVFNLQQTRKSLGNHCAGSDVLENSQNE